MKKVFIGLVVIALAACAYVALQCPCERVPGFWLRGDMVEAPVADWSFANDMDSARLCQLQIDTWRPHSINLNCMSKNQALYVSCSNCAGKSWSNSALDNPDANIRIAGRVYPVTLTRLTEQAQLDTAWAARTAKLKREPAPRPDHWWSFQLVSR